MKYTSVRSFTVAILAIFVLSGCAQKQEISLVEKNPGVGTPYEILVATTREPDAKLQSFTSVRSKNTNYANYIISVPPNHQDGQIEWPQGTPNPAKDFVTRRAEVLGSEQEFVRRLNARMAGLPKREREVILFVHGYNTNFPKAIYGLTQITHDFRNKGVPVLYSWPSASRLTGYVYDRDSAIIARDGLEDLLVTISNSKAEKIVLVAHSMGGFLAMETMRQMSDRKDIRLHEKLAGVILLSPDIDIDVFRSQVARIQPLPQPFIVLVSKQDGALWISSRLARDQERLGSIKHKDLLADLNITLVDSSGISGGDTLHHRTFATSPAMTSILAKMNDANVSVLANSNELQNLVLGSAAIVGGAVQAVADPAVE